MNESKKLAQKGRYEWTEKTYYNDQKLAIIGSLLWIILCLFAWTEVVAKYDELISWKKCIFIILGYGGDSMAIKILGKASDRAMAVIDDKSFELGQKNNTLDSPTPAVMPKDKTKTE
jgi:hypothetical protein